MNFTQAIEQVMGLLKEDYEHASIVSIQPHCGKLVIMYDTGGKKKDTRRLGVFVEMDERIVAENTIIIGGV